MSNRQHPQRTLLRRAGGIASRVAQQILMPDAIPGDLGDDLVAQAQAMWHVRGALLNRLMATVYMLIGRGLPPMQALQIGARQLNLQPRRMAPTRPGMSAVQVRQYHRRQQQRGRRPGQNPQMRSRMQREHEFESELAAAATLAEWERSQPEQFITDLIQQGLNQIGSGVSRLRERALLTNLLAQGIRDEATLTNQIFFARHPELGGRPLRKNEDALVQEWLGIRDGLVRPALAGATTPSTPSSHRFQPIAVESPGGGRIQNKRDPAPADLVTVTGHRGQSVRLHRLAAQAWQAMVAAARSAGLAAPLLLPTSGYRSSQHQARLWESALARYGSPEEARKWVAPPGGSAHQSGRAIDLYLGSSNSSGNVAQLRQTPAYQWLRRNARAFGFYPYEREPWHWEYNPPA